MYNQRKLVVVVTEIGGVDYRKWAPRMPARLEGSPTLNLVDSDITRPSRLLFHEDQHDESEKTLPILWRSLAQ